MNEDRCPHCGMDKKIRNPSGHCDHLYFPENCPTCKSMTTPNTAENPQHYKNKNIEHWDVAEDWNLDYLLGCATKYMSRHMDKGTPILDIEKSIVYTKRYLAKLIRSEYHKAVEAKDADAIEKLTAKAEEHGVALIGY